MKRDFILNQFKRSVEQDIDLAIFDLRSHGNEVFKCDLSFGTSTKDYDFLHVSLWKESDSFNIWQDEIEKFLHYLSVDSFRYSVDWNTIEKRLELNFYLFNWL